ncbi:hypothetical protein OUZ56_001265 [Daphnia magna]|uniref:Uncharacterized protein n=1 Tax=Daphnia magna TaxID=35525 RepID=A0ABR0A2Q1_9CRUS|nr:hypothetical protein OUZ56_001265 [Daphnia magna]
MDIDKKRLLDDDGIAMCTMYTSIKIECLFPHRFVVCHSKLDHSEVSASVFVFTGNVINDDATLCVHSSQSAYSHLNNMIANK